MNGERSLRVASHHPALCLVLVACTLHPAQDGRWEVSCRNRNSRVRARKPWPWAAAARDHSACAGSCCCVGTHGGGPLRLAEASPTRANLQLATRHPAWLECAGSVSVSVSVTVGVLGLARECAVIIIYATASTTAIAIAIIIITIYNSKRKRQTQTTHVQLVRFCTQVLLLKP